MNLLLSSALQWNVEFILINTSCLCLSPFSRALSHAPASLHINQTQHCKLLPGMVSSQAQLCRSNLELMQTIIQAAREVKKTCQKTFADMRWNCSSIDIPGDAPKYRPDLDRGMVINSFRKDRADAVSKETLQVFFFFFTRKSLMFMATLDIQWISQTKVIKCCMSSSSVYSNSWNDPQSCNGVCAQTPQ